MYTRLGGSTSQEVLRWMKNNTGDLGLTISSLELLHYFSAISGVDFDDVTSCRSCGNQSSIWVHSHRTNFGVMSWNDEVDRFVHD